VPRFALVGALVCLLASCSDSVEPNPGRADLLGLWNATISGISARGPSGEGLACRVDWVMSIWPENSAGDSFTWTRLPMTATMQCGGGLSGPFYERGFLFNVRQAGETIVFLDGRLDTFVVAAFRSGGGALTGRTAHWYYPGAQFMAAKLGHTVDPNRSPYLMEIQGYDAEIEVADSALLVARVHDAYFEPITDIPVTWSSSSPGIASVRSDGMLHAISPGLVTIRGTVNGLKDTAQIRVLSPAASVKITNSPDSLLPFSHDLLDRSSALSSSTLDQRH
jgi:hypothetical protein